MDDKTMNATALTTRCQTLELVGHQQLVVERSLQGNVLKILSEKGQVTLSIAITPAGPVLRFEGSGLMIQTTGELAIDAGTIAIHGREGVFISSGKDGQICVDGDLSMQAASHNIAAELGNVNIHANDDVKLDGERIRMNC
jgi:hypothetical protein